MKMDKYKISMRSCANFAQRGNFDEILDNFHKVVTVRAAKGNGFVDKFDSFMAEAGASKLKAQGAALTLKKLADDTSWAEMTKGGYTLKRFEGNIPDIETKHELDVLFESASGKKRSIEMKNWSEAQAITGTTYDQFKAYITSGNDFIYYFSDQARAGMKGKFQDLYKISSKLEELWTANPQYFKQFKITSNGKYISSWQQIKTLADEGKLIDHELLNFVK